MSNAWSEYTPSVYANVAVARAVLAVTRLLELIVTGRRPFRRAVAILIIVIMLVILVRMPLLPVPVPLPHELPEWLQVPLMPT